MSETTSIGPAWFRVEGMTCQNCARHARESAESVAGVAGASVNVDAGRLRVSWAAGAVPDPEGVVAAVTNAGFATSLLEDEPVRMVEQAPGAGWRFNVFFGGSVTLFLMLAEWGMGWMHSRWYPLLAFALASPVQVFCGARFYRGAINQLKRGASNMDTLVALGSTAAFGFSAWIVFAGHGGHVLFMESTAIISLISVGHWLEALATARASGALRALLNLAPATARRLQPDGSEREVPASELMIGDRVALRPGDRVPADAEVTEGASAVDESMISGESKPVEKIAGTRLLAGTRNLDGRLVARITATGDATALAQIMAAVERAQNSRASIQRLADQVSSIFVPVVVVLAAWTALWWGVWPESARAVHAWLGQFLWAMPVPEGALAAAVLQSTSVLIVACPCAMGLATPAAIMAGANAAALRGILIRDGVALEKAGRIDTVVFDKTGTLTVGRLTVLAVRDLRPDDERVGRVETLGSSVARGSTHPVAQAIAALVPPGPEPAADQVPSTHPASTAAKSGIAFKALPLLPGHSLKAPAPADAAKSGRMASSASLRSDLGFVPKGMKVPGGGWQEWRELRGRGIEARKASTPGVVHRLGALAWLHDCGVQDVEAEKGGAVARGAAVTLVGLSADDRLLALFELRDALRPEAPDLVSALQRDGFQVMLLTGDAWLAAEAVAKEAGIASSNVLAEVKPEQKAESLARLQAAGRRVAFVGDGINDGPALAQADLGIAVSRATDVARESADVVLIRGGLSSIREAIGLSQATLWTIRQNLFWAFFYNAAAIPLAMLGFFNPILCAAAMGASDLLVIGNALRLRYWTLAGHRPRPGRRRV